MNRSPMIGITAYGRNEKDHYTLPANYIESIRRAGGIPFILPPGEPALGELLPLLDGLILSGGGDIDPRYYQGSDHDTIYMLDEERDQAELQLAETAVARELPLLGICRGIQVINVALGGTLIEHLPDEVGESILHRREQLVPASHEIHIEPDSRLAGIVGKNVVTGVSWHHQAVRKPAPGLEVVARAPDGTIEAVEMPEHPWLIAIQWHPEITAATDPNQQKLFDELVRMARQRLQAKLESNSREMASLHRT